jgi:hypothetical protein
MISKAKLIAASLGVSLVALLVVSIAIGSPGAATETAKAPSSLTAVRNAVDRWLAISGFKGFRVSEVMAFANNDYVAVHDRKGNPAFELLTDRNLDWLMQEPSSMMWNTRFGMMGGIDRQPGTRGFGPMMGGWMMGGGWNGWYGSGTANRVTTSAKAIEVANNWLARARPGERVEGMGSKYPGYYTLDTARNGKTQGMLSVNTTTGGVWYHGWHGRFLAEKEF